MIIDGLDIQTIYNRLICEINYFQFYEFVFLTDT